jgi:hypothetical protein
MGGGETVCSVSSVDTANAIQWLYCHDILLGYELIPLSASLHSPPLLTTGVFTGHSVHSLTVTIYLFLCCG